MVAATSDSSSSLSLQLLHKLSMLHLTCSSQHCAAIQRLHARPVNGLVQGMLRQRWPSEPSLGSGFRVQGPMCSLWLARHRSVYGCTLRDVCVCLGPAAALSSQQPVPAAAVKQRTGPAVDAKQFSEVKMQAHPGHG